MLAGEARGATLIDWYGQQQSECRNMATVVLEVCGSTFMEMLHDLTR